MRPTLRFITRGMLVASFLLAMYAAPLALSQTPAQRSLGSIAGRVTRVDTGTAVADAVVQLRTQDGLAVKAVATDGSGQYELSDVPAGAYRIYVDARGLVTSDATVARPAGAGKVITLGQGQHLDRSDVDVGPLSALDGRVLNEVGAPAAGVSISIARTVYVTGKGVLIADPRVARTDATGSFHLTDLLPGDYYVMASAGPFSDAPSPGVAAVKPADPTLGYATTLFPGTRDALSARPIRVEFGRNTTDISFSLVTDRIAKVSGAVTDAAGNAIAGARLMLLQTKDGETQLASTARADADPKGAFSYSSILPGTYMLQAFAPGLFGRAPITIGPAGDDLVGVQVTVHPLITARGHVSFDGAPPPTMDLINVGFAPSSFTSGPIGSNRIETTMHDDWTFEIANLAWMGTIRVIAPPGWAMKSLMLSGHDIADEPYDFQSADVNNLEIVMTNRLGSIFGTVADGFAPTAAAVVIFAEDSAKWTFPSRFVGATQAGANGTFAMPGVLAGHYRVIAVPSMTPPVTQEWLAGLRPFATAINVLENGSVNVPLRLIRK